MSYEFLEVSKDDHVWTVTINRPERMNAIHPPTSQELDSVFNDFAADDDAWVAILTGAGDRAFSAGNDLKYQAEHGSKVVRVGMKGVRGGFGGITARFDLHKPMIAAVNGFALGGGFELVLACDIIIASEKATFGLPEPRVGLMAGALGVHRLPRQIPYHQAMGMLLTGRHITPQEAKELGIVNEVCAHDDLLDRARAWAAQILECAPLSVRASKEAANKGLGMALEQAAGSIFPWTAAMNTSEDLVEGPRAFAEKRPPNWKGR